jgi:hypothetical protein
MGDTMSCKPVINFNVGHINFEKAIYRIHDPLKRPEDESKG